MRRLLLGALLVMTASLVPVSTADAQVSPSCQNLILGSVLPPLNAANRFAPGGQFPVGYAPMTQPWGTSPIEGALTWPVPGFAGGPPPNLNQIPDPNPAFSASSIYQALQRDGAWDRLSPTEQADWLTRLANVAAQESNILAQQWQERATFAQQMREAQRDQLNQRRIAVDVSIAMQERSRGWRDSLSNYANVMLALTNTVCPATGVAGAAAGLGGIAGPGSLTCQTNPSACNFVR